MIIKSKFKEYSVEFINSFSMLEILNNNKAVYFVIDKKVYELYKDNFPLIKNSNLYLIDAVEAKKDIYTALSICEEMTKLDSKRNTYLVSIGGGIVQDITGFVANMLYRGISWTFFPTTLLAASDSCIGGKSSLNYKGFKNMLGSFYPPDQILINPSFFNTLANEDYFSGLGEVVKFNIISGVKGILKIESEIDKLIARDYSLLIEFIKSSLLFKKEFIEEDEFDKDKRILLNFAHTFGHAFETVSSYQIPHGTAVAMGIIAANNISLQRGIIDKQLANRVEAICKKIIIIKMNKTWFDIDIIIAAIKKDKKQTNSSNTVILLKSDISLGIYKDIQISEIYTSIANMEEVLDIK